MPDKIVLGKNIKRYRERKNLTQQQLADGLFVSCQAISAWERGVSLPTLEMLCNLSEILEASPEQLLYGREENAEVSVGVDGGGTKTEFVVFDETGYVQETLILSGCNPNDVGMEECMRILSEGLRKLNEKKYEIRSIFCGIAGGASSGASEIAEKVLGKQYRYCTVRCGGDMENVFALSGTTADEDVLAVICGTGIVVCGRINGELRRVGGWGYLFDGGGSGFDIGGAAIRRTLSEEDGFLPSSVLGKLTTEKLGGNAFMQLGECYRKGKRYVASFAEVVFRAMEQGDVYAEEIIQQNAEAVAKLIRHGAKAWGYTGKVTACGGLFSNLVFADYVQQQLSMPLYIPKLPPVYGACVNSLRLWDAREETPEFYQTFLKTYEKARKY